MGFFHARDRRRNAAEPDDDGGISAREHSRLEQLSGDGAMFTSELSVNEFALLGRIGPRPLAQVMGASVVRTGWQYLPALRPSLPPSMISGVSRAAVGNRGDYRHLDATPNQVRGYLWTTPVVCELEVLADAWNLARRSALERLTEEALQVGADAVVGVRLQRDDHDLGKRSIELMIRGTAIRRPGPEPAASPTLTHLSVQDYWRLHSSGYEPVGLLATTAVMFGSASRDARLHRARTVARTQELTELSRAFHAARDAVRARLAGQVADAGGTGAVGVELSHAVRRETFPLASAVASVSRRGWSRGRLGIPYYVSGKADGERPGWVITMHASGTAIRRRVGPARSAPETQIWLGG